MQQLEQIEKAFLRLSEVAKDTGGIKPHITNHKLYVELSNGMSLNLSKEEVRYQAWEHDRQKSINGLLTGIKS